MINIHSKGESPSGDLSNFAAHSFTLDGVECASMEGFLQSLKFRGDQAAICRLVGKEAKVAPGRWRNLRWKLTGQLCWQGHSIRRTSAEYTALITRAYDALYENEAFREALRLTGHQVLTHNIGSHKKRMTVLTEEEFIGQLYRLRERLHEGERIV